MIRNVKCISRVSQQNDEVLAMRSGSMKTEVRKCLWRCHHSFVHKVHQALPASALQQQHSCKCKTVIIIYELFLCGNGSSGVRA